MTSAYDLLDVGFVALSVLISFGVLACMFFRLELIIEERGSLDLYFYFMGWSLALQFILYLIYAGLYAIL